jgi:hypothetical protein
MFESLTRLRFVCGHEGPLTGRVCPLSAGIVSELLTLHYPSSGTWVLTLLRICVPFEFMDCCIHNLGACGQVRFIQFLCLLFGWLYLRVCAPHILPGLVHMPFDGGLRFYFLTCWDVNVGHVVKFPASIAFMNVDGIGEPAAAFIIALSLSNNT